MLYEVITHHRSSCVRAGSSGASQNRRARPAVITSYSIHYTKLYDFRAYLGVEIEVEGIAVSSGVSDQPMTEEETRMGAVNRVGGARELVRGADFYVGISYNFV